MNRQREFLPYAARGVTLLELMAVIAIVAILATIAIPSFSEIIKNNRVASQNNELIAIVSFARSEAVRRSGGIDVTISREANPQGWSAEVYDGTDLLRSTVNTRVELDLGGDTDRTFAFNSRGYLGTAGVFGAGQVFTLRHINCTPESIRQQRLIQILPSGQILSSEQPCE